MVRLFYFSFLKNVWVKPFWLVLLFLSMEVNSVECKESNYYSIHLSSFKHLINANKQVNNLKVKGKIVFWKKADVPDKGTFYRVYIGKYKDYDKAFNVWKGFDEVGIVSYLGIHKFNENLVPDNMKQFKSDVEQVPREHVELPPKIVRSGRFIDNGDGTVTDIETSLMWVKNGWRIDLVSSETWWNAQKICSEFRQSGYSDWRVPSIEEWRSLIDKKMQWPAMVEPNPFENIIVRMPYWTRNSWTKKSPGAYSSRAYIVMLHSGIFYHQNKKERAFIFPVRSIN